MKHMHGVEMQARHVAVWEMHPAVNKTCSLTHTTLEQLTYTAHNTQRNPNSLNALHHTHASQTEHHTFPMCVNACTVLSLCLAHPENKPDASHITSSSCRDWLLARHGKTVWRKLMLDSLRFRSIFCRLMSDLPRSRYIFCRCCALATLDDTLHQSSVVGYMCKTIQ